MNRIKQAAMLLFVSAVCFASSFPSMAASGSQVTNKGRTGAVDIKLSSVAADNQSVVPGQTVPYPVSVTNTAEPAWLRVRVSFPADSDGTALLGAENLNLSEGSWIQKGDCWYLTVAAASGQTVDFLSGIMLPASFTSPEETFSLSLAAEAIQERNFTPDFTLDDPWHGAVIEAYDAQDYKPGTAGNDRFQVVYEGSSDGIIDLGEDFFSNWENLMPGDTVSGEAEIKNGMNLPVQLFFSTDTEYPDDTVRDFLSQVHLKITHGNKTVFDDTLDKDLDEILLQEYQPGESAVLSYTLSLPGDLDNKYAELAFETQWKFRSRIVYPEEPEIIKTGDLVSLFRRFGIAILFGVAALSFYLYERRSRHA